MPLENLLPAIDDRRFDDIVAEARTRIARYAPEWTDLNDNDPGIALVQVFAWLTEMLIYRLGKVPELNYLKFLELLGIELNAAEPALTEITFPVLNTSPDTVVIVPARTQISAESPEGGPAVVFETERSLFALRARLAAVQSFDGYAFTDVSPTNNEAEAGFEPFGSLAAPDSALFLGFALNEPFPQVELNLAVYAFEETSRSAPASLTQCGLQQTPVFPSARIVWETWNGHAWQSLGLLRDDTNALTKSGHIQLRLPPKGEMKTTSVGEVATPLYWIRARLARSEYEQPPKLLTIRTNTIAASQAETARDEVLGGSDGNPNQTFQLANSPVLHGSLVLEVDEGDRFRPWTRVNDFLGSGPDDEHYVLDRTDGKVHFGDGTNGHIPVANVNNPTGNVVAREYRFGGGKRGNVAAGTLKTMVTSVAGIDQNAIGNLLAATSGRDEETLAQARLRAPHALKNKCRAVTEEDFQSLAMQAANIRRAKALSLFHPGFPGVKVPGVVTVIVVPESDQPNPSPSEGTRKTVCAYLNERRLLTTEVFVVAPTYRLVEVRVEATATASADLAEVSQAIDKTLVDYFHPLNGGEDGNGWPFGATIFYSRVYQRVFTVPGIQSIERLVITLDGEAAPECANVPIGDGVLLYSIEHDVNVNYAFDS
jgi:predicted phage baseplate assembly protein